MSTLTRLPSEKKIPEYKDYMNFVSAYGNGTKKETIDEMHRQNVTVSMRSTLENPKTCESYSNFLEKTKNKKFGSVKPPIASRDAVDSIIVSNKEINKVKTEIFIEINATQNKSIDSTTIEKKHVNDTIKKIETQNIQSSTIQNNKISEVKKILESKTVNSEHKQTVQMSSKSFCTENKQINLDKGSNYSKFTHMNDKQTDKINHNNINGSEHSNGNVSQHPIDIINSKLDNTKNVHEKIVTSVTSNSTNSENIEIRNEHHNIVSENENNIKEIFATSTSTKEQLIQQLNKTFSKTEITENGDVKKIELNKIVKEDTVNSNFSSNSSYSTCSPPPPPPPMPSVPIKINQGTLLHNQKYNYTTNHNQEHHHQSQQNVTHSNNKSQISTNGNDSNGVRKKSIDVLDSKPINQNKSSTLDRTDPLVRKLAYGAMLDMYGAYHDKANSYVATLPKKNVQKQSNLQKIIDNIAAQGGLDKLSGRSNPKSETE